jgi:hypothetical protein
MNVSIEDEGGYATMSWTSNNLERIGAADELQLASFKKDGTLRKPVTIWVVRVGDDLYVRAYRGRETAWFRHAQQRHEGRIGAGGVTKDVTFVDVSDNEALNNEIDAAYQSKYQRYSATYADPMIAPQARATTLKPVPSA